MPITREEDETTCVLRLEGEMEISAALELKEQLLHALASKKPLHVNLAGASEIDVTIIQLLWVATSEANRSSSSISLEGPVSQQITAALGTAGLANSLEIRS